MLSRDLLGFAEPSAVGGGGALGSGLGSLRTAGSANCSGGLRLTQHHPQKGSACSLLEALSQARRQGHGLRWHRRGRQGTVAFTFRVADKDFVAGKAAWEGHHRTASLAADRARLLPSTRLLCL